MSDCEHLTARRRWCKVPALPGNTACRHRLNDERCWSTDDYRIADYRSVDEQYAVRINQPSRRR